MPLDYRNLPLLLTIEEVAEMFRCSTGTVRSKLKADPNWLKPTRHALMRKQLFATSDVLALLGQTVPASSEAEATDPWDPDAAAEAIDQAKRDRMRVQTQERSARYHAGRDAWSQRVASHPPSARARQVLLTDSKTKVDISDDAESFRFRIHFQPRFCPPGWPGRVPIPRGGPDWVTLDTDAEMNRLQSEIQEVMADYQPLWDAFVAERKRMRRAAKRSG